MILLFFSLRDWLVHLPNGSSWWLQTLPACRPWSDCKRPPGRLLFLSGRIVLQLEKVDRWLVQWCLSREIYSSLCDLVHWILHSAKPKISGCNVSICFIAISLEASVLNFPFIFWNINRKSQLGVFRGVPKAGISFRAEGGEVTVILAGFQHPPFLCWNFEYWNGFLLEDIE